MQRPLSVLAVTNIYPTDAHPTLGVFVEQQVQGLRAIGVPVTVHYVDRIGKGMRAYFQMLKPLADVVGKNQPALLHVMYGGVMADRVTRWNSSCPTIVTFHGSDLLGENHSGLWRQWISHYGVRCSRRAARAADGVVVVSRRLKQALPPHLEESHLRVIPCGIDLEQFRPRDPCRCREELGWRRDVFHVLFASNRGDPVKRPDLAIAAVEQLKNAGVSCELHFLSGISYRDVPVWMNASDVLLLTSAQEGSPTVVKEALACGLPVVSVDVGDVAERIEGIQGCHLARPECEDLARKLRLVEQDDVRVKASDRIQELSTKEIAHRLEGFYRETLSRRGCSSGRRKQVQP